jgi:hypothetical protein
MRYYESREYIQTNATTVQKYSIESYFPVIGETCTAYIN